MRVAEVDGDARQRIGNRCCKSQLADMTIIANTEATEAERKSELAAEQWVGAVLQVLMDVLVGTDDERGRFEDRVGKRLGRVLEDERVNGSRKKVEPRNGAISEQQHGRLRAQLLVLERVEEMLMVGDNAVRDELFRFIRRVGVKDHGPE